MKANLPTTLSKVINTINFERIDDDRKVILNQVIDYVKEKRAEGLIPKLNFICTHNSRRSQLAQVWAYTAAYYNNIEASFFSGGVEVTAFNSRAIRELINVGFSITQTESDNPHYTIELNTEHKPLECFSKVYDDSVNPTRDFAAIMTCSDADQNCPFIPGAEKRIALRYNDPKAFDDTENEVEAYHNSSMLIATEMFYIFSKLK